MEAKPPTHHKKGITSRKSVLTRSLKAIQSNLYKVISNVNFLREKKHTIIDDLHATEDD